MGKISFNLFMIMFIFFFLVLTSEVMSLSPNVQVSTNTMQIEYPKYDTVRINSDHRFHVHVINSTSIKTNKTTSCLFHLYNQTGYDFLNIPTAMELEAYNGVDFAITINGGNFSTAGVYSYVIQCNSSDEVAFASGNFQVTPTGYVLSNEQSNIYVVVLCALFVIFFIFLYGSVKIPFKDYKNQEGQVIGVNELKYFKVLAIGFSYLTLVLIIFFIYSILNTYTFYNGLSNIFYYIYYFMSVMMWILVPVGFLFLLIIFFTNRKLNRALERGIRV